MEPFKKFAAQRIMTGLLLTVAVLWITGTILGLLKKSDTSVTIHSSELSASVKMPASQNPEPVHTQPAGDPPKNNTAGHAATDLAAVKESKSQPETQTHSSAPASATATSHSKQTGHAPAGEKTALPAAIPHTQTASQPAVKKVPGVAFVTATIKPLSYELNERFWGWRPNDILNFTDNINNFQLGVLEVTRRTTVILTERLSRTGSVEALNKNLERAMDWLMTKPERYWFPSPESRYEDALSEIATYGSNLEKGAAVFYSRADTLLPLLASYDNLLGSCDENLVKTRELDGEPVSWYRVDDYFYYAKGVATALEIILEAVMEDFQPTLETRHGMEIIHHAIKSCKEASEIEPWFIVTDADYSGVLANHRANMAARISHARFYIEVLVAVLST